jgi:hypothetical protein
MITKFRIEATHADKELLMAQLEDAAVKVMKLAKDDRGVSEANEPDCEWECTQDVITGSPGQYAGRMVFVLRVDD